MNLLLILFSSVMVCGEEDLKKIIDFASDGFPTKLEQKQVNIDATNVENPLEQADTNDADDFKDNPQLTSSENKVVNQETTTSVRVKPDQEITNPTAPKKKVWSTTAKVITGGLVASLFTIPVGFKIKEIYDERNFNSDMVELFNNPNEKEYLKENSTDYEIDTEGSDYKRVFSFDVCQTINAYIDQKELPAELKFADALNPNDNNLIQQLKEFLDPEVTLTFDFAKKKVKKVKFANNATNNAKNEEMFFKLLYHIAAKNVKHAIKYLKLIQNQPIDSNLRQAFEKIDDFIHSSNSSTLPPKWKEFCSECSKIILSEAKKNKQK